MASEFCNTNITSVESISEIAVPIFARYPAIEKAWVFGSFARQDQGPESDVDISLLIDSGKQFSLFDLSHLGIDLEDAFQKECDIVTGKVKYKCIQQAIERERVLIYER